MRSNRRPSSSFYPHRPPSSIRQQRSKRLPQSHALARQAQQQSHEHDHTFRHHYGHEPRHRRPASRPTAQRTLRIPGEQPNRHPGSQAASTTKHGHNAQTHRSHQRRAQQHMSTARIGGGIEARTNSTSTVSDAHSSAAYRNRAALFRATRRRNSLRRSSGLLLTFHLSRRPNRRRTIITDTCAMCTVPAWQFRLTAASDHPNRLTVNPKKCLRSPPTNFLIR